MDDSRFGSGRSQRTLTSTRTSQENLEAEEKDMAEELFKEDKEEDLN